MNCFLAASKRTNQLNTIECVLQIIANYNKY